MRSNALQLFDKTDFIAYTIHMKSDSETEIPKIRIATEPWVMEQIMDTENRIERAFHDQTKFLNQQQALANEKLDTTIRWGAGLIITMIVALVLAIFIQPYIGPR